MYQSSKILYLLLFLALLSLIPNLGVYEFKNEESLRTIIAYEMQASGNYIQPTYLGEEYYKKPPLFTWLTLFSAQLTGWNELAPRIPSLISYVLTSIFVFLVAKSLFGSRRIALLASLIYVSTIEMMFFYGFIGEIDATFSLSIFLVLACLLLVFEKDQLKWLIPAGLFTAMAFMLKGFPAFIFFGATFITLLIVYKKYNLLRRWQLYLSIGLSLILPMLWLTNTNDPNMSFNTLFMESADRTRSSVNLPELITHFFTFPIQSFIKLLPGSLFLVLPFLLFVVKRNSIYLKNDKFEMEFVIKVILLVTLINFLPYWLSTGARVRYILPLLPLLSIVTAYVLIKYTTDLFIKRLVQTIITVISLRFALGILILPLAMDQRNLTNSDKRVAENIQEIIDVKNSNIACDCFAKKSVCLYLGINNQQILKTSNKTHDPEYLISCDSNSENYQYLLLKEYPSRKNNIFLYQIAHVQ